MPVPKRIRTKVFCTIAIELRYSLGKNVTWTNLRKLAEKHLPRQYKEYAADLLDYFINKGLLKEHGGRQGEETLELTEKGRRIALKLCLKDENQES